MTTEMEGRVLFCGQLEKRRDGAVRGGWATRVFLLTPDSLHYFRRVSEQELLGEERGHVSQGNMEMEMGISSLICGSNVCSLHYRLSNPCAPCQKTTRRPSLSKQARNTTISRS